jgi:hypothetical protein
MTITRLMRVGCVVLFLGFGFACSAMGQTETATVSGLITDDTGAVVPGAEVKLQSVDRGTVATATTNDAGIYVFASVHPGPYQVAVHKPGFKQVDLLGMIVNVQDHIEQNFRLQIGSVAESVTVNANDIHLNTTDASVSTVVDQTYVKNMPLNGRSFQDLILLTPGTVTQTPQASSSGVPTTLGTSGEFSVNGQRTESNYYTVDGVSANVGAAAGGSMILGAGPTGSLAAATALGTTQALVSVDALQEFRVQSSTYSSEYGRNPGGQFVFETKSGTNQWHGTGYDYLRNNAFDAADWFNNYFGLTGAALRQNDFGGTVGGPIRIPRLYNGKDKTFFFVSYEGLRLISPQPPCPACFVPDATLRASAPASLNQALNAWPVPSPTGIDDTANGFAQFTGNWSNRSSINSTGVRLDHVVNDKLRLFFRFSGTTSSSAAQGIGNTAPTANTTSVYTLRTYTAAASSVFTNRVSNELRLNYSSNETSNSTVIDALGGSTPADLVRLTGLGPGSAPGVTLIIGPYFTGLSQQESSGAQRQWNFVDTASLSLGRHQFKFGVDYRRLASVAIQTTPGASYIYGSVSAVQNNSAFILALSQAPAYPLYMNFSAFTQDEWRVSQRLSISLGLRWEVNPAPGVTQGLKPYTIQGSSPDNWTLGPQGTPLWRTTWYNFAPRVGLAYILHNSPGRETVVRGGGGVFFDTGQQLGSFGFNGPGFLAFGFSNGPFPGTVVPPPIVNPPSLADIGAIGVAWGFAPHLQLPYTLQWNASIEQALGKSQAVTVSHVGSHASRLLQQNLFFSAKNPSGAQFFFIENGLTSDYDSLQVQFRRRLSRGLTALASYSWSHCIDYGSSNFVIGYRRGSCDFDIRNNFSAAFSYDLPNVGHNGFLNAALHDWGLDNRFTARSGFPVPLNGNQNFDPLTGQAMFSGLDLVPNQPVYLYGGNCATVLQGLGDLPPGKGCPGGRAINPQAFTNASSGFGTAPRNFARGFGAWQMDVAVRRDFPIHERLKLQFRAEAFNVFNHPNFGAINSRFGQPTFGQATGTLANSLGILSPLYQQGGARSMQFALKLVF